MLKFYLTTVLIYLVIIFASEIICLPVLKKNSCGEDEDEKETFKIKGIITTLAVSVVPVIRLLVVVGIYMLAFEKKEEKGL